MPENNNTEEMREQFVKMCPDVIAAIKDMLGNPATPASVKAQLISIVLDRAMGKPETPVKVTTNVESFEEAEAELVAMVRQIQAEHGMIPIEPGPAEKETGFTGFQPGMPGYHPGEAEIRPDREGTGMKEGRLDDSDLDRTDEQP